MGKKKAPASRRRDWLEKKIKRQEVVEERASGTMWRREQDAGAQDPGSRQRANVEDSPPSLVTNTAENKKNERPVTAAEEYDQVIVVKHPITKDPDLEDEGEGPGSVAD